MLFKIPHLSKRPAAFVAFEGSEFLVNGAEVLLQITLLAQQLPADRALNLNGLFPVSRFIIRIEVVLR